MAATLLRIEWANFDLSKIQKFQSSRREAVTVENMGKKTQDS